MRNVLILMVFVNGQTLLNNAQKLIHVHKFRTKPIVIYHKYQ